MELIDLITILDIIPQVELQLSPMVILVVLNDQADVPKDKLKYRVYPGLFGWTQSDYMSP